MREETDSNAMKQGMKITIICDQAVDVHFPAHFHAVYTKLLRERGFDTQLIAFFRRKNSKIGNDLEKKGAILFSKYSGTGLLGRLAYSVLLLGRLLGLLASSSHVRNSRAYLVQNDPVIGLFIFGWAKVHRRCFIYRITHLMAEELIEEKSGNQRMMARISRILRNWLISRSNFVVPMSAPMADVLGDQTKIGAERIQVVGSMVDVTGKMDQGQGSCRRYLYAFKEKMAQYGFDDWLVYLGTLSPTRNLGFLIDTLLEVRRRGINSGLLVLGVANREWHLTLLKEYSARHGAEDYILWADPIPEACLPEILQLARVGLSPLPTQGACYCNSPVKTLEYIKAGLPVVGSPLPDHYGVIEASGSGIIANNHASEFADAIVKLLREKREKRVERIAAARKWLLENRDISKAADTFASVLRKCCGAVFL